MSEENASRVPFVEMTVTYRCEGRHVFVVGRKGRIQCVTMSPMVEAPLRAL